MKLTRKLRSLTSHRRSAADVAAAAGTADNPLRRRGSVLVLVLGALALISVVTLVYVTVGKGDILTSTTIRDRSNVDAAVSSISDHLNSVIASSTVATFVDGYEGATPITIRKAWDYPFVDSYRRSVTNNAAEAFNPSGSYADPVTGVDRRLPYQPWLSTTLPTDLLGAGLSSADPPDPLDPEDAKDWGMFSNFAPDGRFVNLWNLAPYVLVGGGYQRISRFDAYSVEPGSNGVPTAPSTTSSEMSYGVTLLNPTTGRSYDAGASLLPDGTNALPNVPAHWTMRQVRAMRLAGRDRFFGPSQYQYGPYQYCDADGDGFFDSRWIELVNATDPDNPISLLPRDDRFRWFVAARAVDLNALVNVNIATDLRQPARQTNGAAQVQVTPQGMYPSDIDLLRILRMDDTYRVYGFGYDELERFVTNPQSDFYNGNYDLDLARLMGHRAYNGIRQALTFNNVRVAAPDVNLMTTPTGALAALTGDARFQYYQFWGAQPTASYYIAAGAKRFSLSGQFGDADLLELLSYRGVNNPKITSRLEQVTDGRVNQFAPGGGTVDESRMGPLRSDRSAEKEIGTADNDGTGNQGDGEADRDAFIRLAADIRKLLTTISHDRQFSSAYRAANRAAHYPVAPATTVTLGKLTNNDLTRDAIDAAAETGPAPIKLFTGYCDALLPYSWRENFWTTNYGRYRTLSYGHNPELALRFAAHMAANFRDMYDKANLGDPADPGRPGAYTLILNGGAATRTALGQNSTNNFPWWTANARLDLDPDFSTGGTNRRLYTAAAVTPNVSTPAINVFGMEAQPFITQVSSIVIYSDAPSLAGGDDEIDPADQITIDGDYSAPTGVGGPGSRPSNPDFLGEILAFQITNPFDVDIPLSESTHTDNYQAISTNANSFTEYYLEYNGNLFKFAADMGTTTGEGIILRKGETRNFYVLSNPIADMQARFARLGPPAAQVNGVPTDAVQRFIDNQLGLPAAPGLTYVTQEQTATGSVRPILLRGMNPLNGQTVAYSGDLYKTATALPPGSPTPDELKRTVFLWRKLALPPGAPPASRAPRATHMLADRLHDPATIGFTFDRLLPSGPPQSIQGTNGGPEPSPIGAPAGHDNTGFTIALWGSVKRTDNPANLPLGAIPSYCVEARTGWVSAAGFRNFTDTDGASPSSLSRTDFTGTNPNADVTFPSFLSKTIIPLTPGPTRTRVFITTGGNVATMTVPAHLKAHGPHRIGNNGNNRPFNLLYPQIPLENNRFEETLGTPAPAPTISTLRLADLLLPLAIGPEFNPGLTPIAVNNGESIQTPRCMTLAESLALGLNYCNPPTSDLYFGIYHNIGDNSPQPHPTVPSTGAVDRGNLNLSKFSPFEDFNADLLFQPSPAGRDSSRWPGIPLALNILNVFSTAEPQFIGLTKATPGRINLNTAPVPVLRAIPLLSPTTDETSLPTGGRGLAWTSFKALSGFTSADRPLPDLGSDIAAAFESYRDKSRVLTRDTAGLANGQAAAIVNFEDSTTGPNAFRGRYETTQIDGLREATGFASVGEMMAITSPGYLPTTAGTTRLRATDRVDQVGVDGLRGGTAGTASVRYKNAAGAKVVDEIVDDYQEELVVANAAINSVTVRSDVFAVWFVVHGYQKSDTENLGANDPLVPSVAKRFLMVLDRSNVTRAGEKAKVILFTELPMTPAS